MEREGPFGIRRVPRRDSRPNKATGADDNLDGAQPSDRMSRNEARGSFLARPYRLLGCSASRIAEPAPAALPRHSCLFQPKSVPLVGPGLAGFASQALFSLIANLGVVDTERWWLLVGPPPPRSRRSKRCRLRRSKESDHGVRLAVRRRDADGRL